MGVGAGHEASSSVMAWSFPLGYSGAVCKICFRMTQAGSLPAIPLRDGAAFSVEEIFSSVLVGIFCWLAPAPSLLAGLPQTTLSKSPSTSCLPTVKSMSCFRRAAVKLRRRGLLHGLGAFWSDDFLQLLQPSHSPPLNFSLIFSSLKHLICVETVWYSLSPGRVYISAREWHRHWKVFQRSSESLLDWTDLGLYVMD